MENLTRHAQGNLIQLAQFIGKSVPQLPNSTLNQKFQVAQDAILPADAIHRGQYWCIGNGGLYVNSGSGGAVLDINVWPHGTKDTALFSHLPFLLTPITNDLGSVERDKYRMRKQVSYGGQDYFAYYMKKIDMTAVNVILETRVENTGVITVTPFSHTAANLAPTVPNTGSQLVASGEYIAATARLEFSLTEVETTNFLNAIEVIYGAGNMGKGNITEVGLCSGVDIAHTVGGVNYTEVAHARVACSLSTLYPMHKLPSGIQTYINLEAIDSVLVLT